MEERPNQRIIARPPPPLPKSSLVAWVTIAMFLVAFLVTFSIYLFLS
jgi:hypothetical protein